MARGRPPGRSSTASRRSSRNNAVESSTSPSGRLTRSGSVKGLSNLSNVVAADEILSPDPLSSPVGPSTGTTKATPVPVKRGRGRPRKVVPASSESPSSNMTPRDSSEDEEYSTPATSKVQTPTAEGVVVYKTPRTSIQVQLPARSRNNPYSLNPSKTRTEISDSELEDDLSDSLDARAARRLHAQLNKEPKQSQKRARATTSASQKNVPPTKKPKTGGNLDLDAEMAAAAGYDSDESLTKLLNSAPGQVSDSDDEDVPLTRRNRFAVMELDDFDDEPQPRRRDALIADSNEDSFAEESSDEDIPLSSRRKISSAQKAGRTAVSASTATGKKMTRSVGAPSTALQALASDDDGDLSLDNASTISSTFGSTSALSASNASSGSDSERQAQARQFARVTQRRGYRNTGNSRRLKKERQRLEDNHPEIKTMWTTLESMPIIKTDKAPQPKTISRQLKGFQLEGLAWMIEMEKTEWKGGLLGDEMGLGKTIQAVSLIMSDYPAKQPSLVLVPPVALMQWQSEIKAYTDGTLKTFVFHGTNQKTKGMTVKDLKKYDVIMMSYNSLESMYRKQEKGFTRKDGIHKEKSLIHAIHFHRVILDEAHSIKTRTTMTAKACFALRTDYRWCLTGTPLQNRIGEFFSLIRFLNIRPFACYLCKQCDCSALEWSMDEDSRCTHCNHAGMQHVSVFNQELLNPIQKFGNMGPGREAFGKLRLMTDRIMLRRLKKDHTNAMELPVKEIYVDRQFFGEEENDFANSIMTSGQRKFDTYVAQGVLLNNYANIFGLIMQMRQVADHPDLITKKHAEGGQNVFVCCICDEPAEDTVRSRCKHDFCRACVASYIRSTDTPDCPRCHIPLSIDLEQPEIEQDENHVKKSSIINRIKMENWTSSSKIELLVHELHKLRSDNASHKSIIFSQFTTMLQLIEWRLRRAGITTVMLDGTMSPAQRQASIDHFVNNVDVECFLVSLKAGGVALNLTEASRVFIVDPWWNTEVQAADRCHRIGQTRPCRVTRLCIEDSIESKILLLQAKKWGMVEHVVNGNQAAAESLTPEDLAFLFRG